VTTHTHKLVVDSNILG